MMWKQVCTKRCTELNVYQDILIIIFSITIREIEGDFFFKVLLHRNMGIHQRMLVKQLVGNWVLNWP